MSRIRKKLDRQRLYMATMLPGLESVTSDEIQRKIDDTQIVDSQRGKVFFRSNHPLDILMSLRCIDNLFIFISKFPMGPHKIHLKELEAKMANMDVSQALEPDLLKRKNVTFTINSSRSGKHTYSRFNLSEAASLGLLKQLPAWKIGTAEHHQVEFRLDVKDETAFFYLRLTPATFRFRGKSRMFSRAALLPTVAHSLVWLSQPQEDQIFLDPFCGSGTILAERSVYPYQQLIGGDISAEAIGAAKQNVAQHPQLLINQWDAQDLPLDSSSVDLIVSNLPFGEQILNPEDIYSLYLAFTKQLKRVLKPDGYALLLTDKIRELKQVTSQCNLQYECLFDLSLKGLHPKIMRIRS